MRLKKKKKLKQNAKLVFLSTIINLRYPSVVWPNSQVTFGLENICHLFIEYLWENWPESPPIESEF